MHEGDHGIMDHTHEELDKKFGHSHVPGSGGHHHHHHDHDTSGSDKTIQIAAAFLVAAMVILFVVFRVM